LIKKKRHLKPFSSHSRYKACNTKLPVFPVRKYFVALILQEIKKKVDMFVVLHIGGRNGFKYILKHTYFSKIILQRY